MKLSAVRRLALAGSLSASVALGLQLQHGRDARPFGASAAFAQPRAAGVAMLASPAEGRARLIDGKAIAAAVRRDIKASSDELKAGMARRRASPSCWWATGPTRRRTCG